MSYSEYVPKHERPVLSALITALLEGGNSVTVNDGEDDVLERSTSLNAIRSELGGTGEDWLTYYDPAGKRLGFWMLIYNNGSEGDPMVVICDYSVSDRNERIWNTLYAKYDR